MSKLVLLRKLVYSVADTVVASKTTMGTCKRWSVEERLHLTEAWIDATEDAGETEVKGTYQDSDVFWKRVYDKYVAKAPSNHAKGSYSGRQVSAMQNQWKDKLARDVKKFNKSLLRVISAKPTGCTEQNQINMAVAIHLGKTSTMSYVHKEFEANHMIGNSINAGRS